MNTKVDNYWVWGRKVICKAVYQNSKKYSLAVILKCANGANGANEAQMAQMLLKSANAFALER
jgi:hypothetical protein